MANAPVNVTVTGAAGNIGYALLFRIASGAMLGPDQRVNLRLLEIPPALKAAEGTAMELFDAAFPTLGSIDIFDDPKAAFEGANIALLVGSMPRKAGMERADLLQANGAIFTVQGKAIAENAKEDVKVLVVGNPCNTNAYIARAAAIKVGRTNPNNYHGMLRLDHNRALTQLAQKAGRPVSSLKQLVVWGNHSPSMYADYRFVTSNGDNVKAIINDAAWNNDVFLPTVGKRGAAIIDARGLSSAASAANAAIDHIRDWHLGSTEWVTMGIPAPADNGYGIPEGLVFGLPCECKNGTFTLIKGLEIDEYSKGKIAITLKELEDERAAVADMLK